MSVMPLALFLVFFPPPLLGTPLSGFLDCRLAWAAVVEAGAGRRRGPPWRLAALHQSFPVAALRRLNRRVAHSLAAAAASKAGPLEALSAEQNSRHLISLTASPDLPQLFHASPSSHPSSPLGQANGLLIVTGAMLPRSRDMLDV